MRYILVFVLLLFPALAEAQATLGGSLYPMLMINEADLNPAAFERVEYPAAPWNDARTCLEEMGHKVPKMPLPELLVVPNFVQSFRVAEILRDSLGIFGTGFSAPTIAYALSHSHRVLILEHDRNSYRTLRHEAIHLLAWKAARMYGHPGEVFIRCDYGRAVPG